MSGAPHLPQKSDVGGVSALHFAQCFTSAFPHFAQKLLVEGLFVPHFEQGIALPGNQATRTSCIIRCREGAAGRGKANWTPLRLLLREERPRRAVPLRRCEFEFSREPMGFLISRSGEPLAAAAATGWEFLNTRN